MFALASPPTNAYVALWLGMAALSWMLAATPDLTSAARNASHAPRALRLRRAFDGSVRGLAFGFGANVVALRFVPDVIARFTPLPWAAGLVALALLALFEGLRWMIAAMVQLADLVGERGVTLLMALTAGLVASAARALMSRLASRTTRVRGAIALAMAIAIPLLMFAHGTRRMREIEALRAAAPSAKVVLVQPSIAASERWDAARAASILAKLVELTKSAERKGAELTVWPEAAYPYPLPHANRRAPIGELAILPYGVRGPVLTGVVLSEGRAASYNSAFIATADGALTEPQDKQHLLWFGETVPFADRSAWLRRTFARGIGLVPGDRTVVQTVGRVRAGILNCFEDTLPDAGREVATASPNLLVNVTNDAWFAGSGESELHLRLAALRAVELRRDLVRSVNFGPTSWIDASGRVRARYASDIPGTLLTEPVLLDLPATVYARFGDAPVLGALVALSLAAAALAKRRSSAA